jgi:hypothetical protein
VLNEKVWKKGWRLVQRIWLKKTDDGDPDENTELQNTVRQIIFLALPGFLNN